MLLQQWDALSRTHYARHNLAEAMIFSLIGKIDLPCENRCLTYVTIPGEETNPPLSYEHKKRSDAEQRA